MNQRKKGKIVSYYAIVLVLLLHSCKQKQDIVSNVDININNQNFEAIIEDVKVENDSLILIIKYVNYSEDILFIPSEYLKFDLLFNAQKPILNYIIESKTIYPLIVNKEGLGDITDSLCLSYLDITRFIVLKDSLFLQYNLTKLGYAHENDIIPTITGSISANKRLKEYCPYIFTGRKQLKTSK